MEKIQKKAVKKVNTSMCSTSGKRIYMDISSVDTQSFRECMFWVMIVDETTSYKWSRFINMKELIGSEVVSVVKNEEKTT